MKVQNPCTTEKLIHVVYVCSFEITVVYYQQLRPLQAVQVKVQTERYSKEQSVAVVLVDEQEKSVNVQLMDLLSSSPQDLQYEIDQFRHKINVQFNAQS